MDENRPLVSIIVRTKDRPKLLKRALKSIAAQTYRPIEVVLVNDGGCDLDIEEIKGIFGDVSLNYKRLEKNMGRAHAGNIGIESAKGKYVGFLDDDDEFYPEHVETLVSFLAANDLKIAYADTEMVSQLYSPEDKRMTETVTALFSEDFVYEELLINNYIPFNSLLFKSELLDRKKCLDESFDLYEDWDLLIRLARDYVFFHIKKTTAKYYQWSSELQINQADTDIMFETHLRIIGKHLHRITPQLIYRMKQKRDALAAQLEELRAVNREKAQSIAGMELAVADRDRLIGQRDELIRTLTKKDIRIGNLEKSVAERDKEILRQDMHIDKLENRLSQKDITLEEKEGQIVRLRNDLEAIRNTRGWKFLERFRRAREAILPAGLARGNAYRSGKKALGVLQREGPGVFLRKAGNRLTRSGGNGSSTEPTSLMLPTSGVYPDHFPSPRAYRVLFVKWEWAGITNHYRVDNMAEYLKRNGTPAEVLDLEDLPHHIPRVFEFDLVVIHRIPMTPLLKEFISACRSRNIVSVFDIDDYLFEASVIHQVEWVKHTKGTERERLIEHMLQCRQTLEACDYFIAPTEFLANKAGEIGREAFVIRNGFSEALYQSFLDQLQSKAAVKSDGKVRIGYFSGTNTHQKDFQHIIPALLRVLRECENATLYICGLLELDQRFDPFSERIERVPLVPLEELPAAMLPCDINIAPLESSNIFCEAKSELKYIYAGLMKIPSVTSPTDAFRHAITHGENGFLASTVDEWYAHLKTLVNDPTLRVAMGNKAHDNVRNFYSPHALAQQAGAVYREIIKAARQKRNIPEKSFSAGFIIADNPANHEAYRRVTAVAEELAKNGHRITYYYYGSNGDHAGGEIPGSMDTAASISVAEIGAMMSHDVLLCTDPYNSSVTAYTQRARTAHLVYLPGSDKYVDIPHPWATLFHIIPYSPNVRDAVSQLENIIWETTASRKS